MRELIRREKGRRDLRSFVSFMNDNFIFEEFHAKLFNALQRIESGELKRLMVNMPPRSGKTEIITKNFPAYFLGKHPEKLITCISYTADLAVSFGRKAKQITQDQRFKFLFPNFALADDKREGGNWETAQRLADGTLENTDGGYYSVGYGGALTGRGFDIGIIDDPIKNREDAESLTIRDKIWDWYTSTFLTRQQGSNSAIILMMTRWNTDDLAGRILEAEGDKWEVISFPAIDEEGKALVNREGYGINFYNSIKESVSQRDWAALYQQDPIASTGYTFSQADFRYFNFSDLKKEDYTVSISVDPAFSSSKESDDTAVVVTARHKLTKEVYVLDVFGDTISPSDSYQYIVSAAEKWKDWTLEYISIEDSAMNENQKVFIPNFELFLRGLGKFYTLLPHNPRIGGKKEDRIKFTLEPMFNRHAIHFRKDLKQNQYQRKLEEQILRFPVNRHDDLIDCLCQSVIMWNERGGSVDGERVSEYMANKLNKVNSQHAHKF